MREPILKADGHATVLHRDDIDTDALYPAEFLKVTVKQGLRKHLFQDWIASKNSDADFVNAPVHTDILVAPNNFGCGSSREHAVWALADYGIKGIIALSFGDIFRNNCVKNGLVAGMVSEADYAKVVAVLKAASPEKSHVVMDVAKCVATLPDGSTVPFKLAVGHSEQLLSGEDDISKTLRYAGEMKAFEEKRVKEQPWLA